MNIPATAVLLSACAALSACSSGVTHTPAPSQSHGADSPSASASAEPSASANAAAAVNLRAVDIPAGTAGAFNLLTDGLLGGHPLTDQRTFANTAGSVAIESDVIVESSQSAISGDYTQARTAARSRVAAVSAMGTPSIGQRADEFAGTASDGKGIVAITFVRALTVNAVLVEMPGSPDTAFAEQVAQALDARIQSQG